MSIADGVALFTATTPIPVAPGGSVFVMESVQFVTYPVPEADRSQNVTDVASAEVLMTYLRNDVEAIAAWLLVAVLV